VRVKFAGTVDAASPAAPWQVGELVTVEIVTANPDGTYDAETHETYPPDLKEQHAAAIAGQARQHAAEKEAIADAHRRVVEHLAAQIPAIDA
jgi:hypothetical protein